MHPEPWALTQYTKFGVHVIGSVHRRAPFFCFLRLQVASTSPVVLTAICRPLSQKKVQRPNVNTSLAPSAFLRSLARNARHRHHHQTRKQIESLMKRQHRLWRLAHHL